MKFLPSLRDIERIIDIEVEIKRFEDFCWYSNIDKLENEQRIKFELFAFILPEQDMIEFYSFTKKEHVNFENLKKFLRSIHPNSYPQSYTTTSHEISQKEEKLCRNQIDDENEKFEPQTQKENFSPS